MLLQLAASAGASPLANAPFASTFTFPGGATVGLPSCFKAAPSLSIGTANGKALTGVQRRSPAFTPVEILNRGIAFVWLIENLPGTRLDSYREIIFPHHARRQDKSPADTVKSSTVAFYDALWLDSDHGDEAGRAIWGLPKLETVFSAQSTDVPGRIAATMNDAASGAVFLMLIFRCRQFIICRRFQS